MKINSELKSTLTGQDALHEQHLRAVNTLAGMYVQLKKQKTDTEAGRMDAAYASESYKRQKIKRDEGIRVRKDASETAASSHVRMVNTFMQVTEQIDKHNRTMLTTQQAIMQPWSPSTDVILPDQVKCYAGALHSHSEIQIQLRTEMQANAHSAPKL